MVLAQAQTGGTSLGTLEAPTAAFAPTAGTGTEAFATPFTNFLSNLIGFLTLLAGLMFLLYFIFAALSWVTSGGEKGKVESAKNQMTQAALGLVIVVAAYAIAGVVGRVLGLNILDPISVLSRLSPSGATQ
jgi:uncharacterized protein YggT (Ycf19 family)